MATPTIGGPLNVKGKEPAATISAAQPYLSARKQLQLRVSFEEYLYHASITRAEEELANKIYKRAQGPTAIKSFFSGRFRWSSKNHVVIDSSDRQAASVDRRVGEKDNNRRTPSNIRPPAPPVSSFESELHAANRALRTAGWGSVFYLITTDILGPSNTPQVKLAQACGQVMAMPLTLILVGLLRRRGLALGSPCTYYSASYQHSKSKGFFFHTSHLYLKYPRC